MTATAAEPSTWKPAFGQVNWNEHGYSRADWDVILWPFPATRPEGIDEDMFERDRRAYDYAHDLIILQAAMNTSKINPRSAPLMVVVLRNLMSKYASPAQ